MYCLRCGAETAGDAEYCEPCAREMVTDRTIGDEPVPSPSEEYLTRCRDCKQEMLSADDVCPHCGAVQTESPARKA